MAGYLSKALETLWSELSTNPRQISPVQLREETEMLRKGLRKRTIGWVGMSLIVVAASPHFFFVFQNAFERIGLILTVVGAVYISVQALMRRARDIPDVGESDSIRSYRAELGRQRDFHRGTWLWSRFLIILPGPFLLCMGIAQATPKLSPSLWINFALLLVFAAMIVPWDLRFARKYQRRIDALDTSLTSMD